MAEAAPEASTSARKDEPRLEILSIHGGGSIQNYVTRALALLLNDAARPAVQLQIAKSGRQHTALHKLVSVTEVIKREYIKVVSDKSKGKDKLPQRLWQYNHLFSEEQKPSSQRNGHEDLTAEDQELEDAAKAHDDAVQELVMNLKDGRKRPRKSHSPRLLIVLSTHKMSQVSGSFQSPADKKAKRRQKKRKDKDSEVKEGGSSGQGRKTAVPVAEERVAPRKETSGDAPRSTAGAAEQDEDLGQGVDAMETE